MILAASRASSSCGPGAYGGLHLAYQPSSVTSSSQRPWGQPCTSVIWYGASFPVVGHLYYPPCISAGRCAASSVQFIPVEPVQPTQRRELAVGHAPVEVAVTGGILL